MAPHNLSPFLLILLLTTTAPVTLAKEPTRLGIQGTRFTINGKPTFLLSISYFAALGAPEKLITEDLTRMRRLGFNATRVWATWAAFDHDISAVDAEGRARPPFLRKLKWLVTECDRRGMIVDVTLSRGDGGTGPSRLQSLQAHRRAATTITQALRSHGNWYLDLANERNVHDQRFTSLADLKELRRLVRRLDATRLVTASHAGDLSRDEMRQYLDAGLDFLAPHRPRHAGSPGQTAAKSRRYLTWMKQMGKQLPVYYQEPFRRGYGDWQPKGNDYLTDLRGAKASGAAGWCFHNGDQKDRRDRQPRRCFDLREKCLFDQLDADEQKTLRALASR
jgi:hypothetical protein